MKVGITEMRNIISAIFKRVIILIIWFLIFIPLMVLGEKSNLSKHFKLFKLKFLGKE